MFDVALPDQMLDGCPLCPLDDRYQASTRRLRAYFSTPALAKARMCVQVKCLEALSDEPGFPELPPLSSDVRSILTEIAASFGPEDYAAICRLEQTGDERRGNKKVGHDVKAGEYHLQDRLRERGLEALFPYLRFGVTSEDDTNLAYGLLVHAALTVEIRPAIDTLQRTLLTLSHAWRDEPMLGHTHGMPATPLGVGLRVAAFCERLRPLRKQLDSFRMNGKFGGAVGNLFAHRVACPEVDWRRFGEQFVTSLGLVPIFPTTQINPHQDLAELSHLMSRCATVLLDLCQNVWLYLHDNVLALAVGDNQAISSVMPHKVNPQDLETAESALGFTRVLFNYFADALPLSRLERHLSDSHVQRWLGVPFGCFVLAVRLIGKNFQVISVNSAGNRQRILEHPEVFGEALQTTMRRYGCADAYEQVRALTRGQHVTATGLASFVMGLTDVPSEAQGRLLALLDGDLSQVIV